MAISDIKKAYSSQEWTKREEYYTETTAILSIPLEPTVDEIKRLNALVDNLQSEALVELAYVRRTCQDYKIKQTLAEKELFVILKQQQVGNGNKITENDVKGLVVTHLKNKPLDKMTRNIYSIVSSCEYRLTFMEAVVKILSEKRNALTANLALFKLENNISPVDTGKVNNNNYRNHNNYVPPTPDYDDVPI